MALPDSLVRLKQLSNPEVSGYVVSIIKQYLTTGTVTGIASNTGQLTGVFYPLKSNPLQYVNSGNLTGYATKIEVTGNNINLLALVDVGYYPRTNPSGFVTGFGNSLSRAKNTFLSADAAFIIYDAPNDINILEYGVDDYFYLRALNGTSHISLISPTSPVPYITGFDIYTTGINGKYPASINDLSGYVPTYVFTKSGNPSFDGLDYLWASSTSGVGTLYFDSNAQYYLEGNRAGFPSERYLIDLYGRNNSGPVATGHPYIYGFDIYASKLTSSGNRVLTTVDLSGFTGNNVFADNTFVRTTGSQNISGIKAFQDLVVVPQIYGTFTLGKQGFDYLLDLKSGWLTTYLGGKVIQWGGTSGQHFLSTGTDALTVTPTLAWGLRRLLDHTTPTGWLQSGSYSGVSMDWENRILFNNSGIPSINYKSGVLYNSSGTGVLSYQSGMTYDTTGKNSINWYNRTLIGATGNTGLHWQSGRLYDRSGVALDWNQHKLSGQWEAQYLQINDNLNITGNLQVGGSWTGDFSLVDTSGYERVSINQTSKIMQFRDAGNILRFDIRKHSTNGLMTLFDSLGQTRFQIDPSHFYFTDWNNFAYITDRGLMDAGGVVALDWANRALTRSSDGASVLSWDNSLTLDSAQLPSMNWNLRYLYSSSQVGALDWENRQLLDNSATYSLDWSGRKLLNTSGTEVFNWANSYLTGTWNAQSILISGKRVLTLADTGLFATGSFTGGGSDDGLNVRLTGDQVISGRKNFQLPVYVGQLHSNQDSFVGSQVYVDVPNRVLYDANPIISIDWGNYQLSNTGNITLDWKQKQLTGLWNIGDTKILHHLAVNNIGALSGASGYATIDLANYQLKKFLQLTDTSGELILDPSGNPIFEDTGIALDWSHQILSGNWMADTLSANSLQVSGFNVVLTSQTGAFGGGGAGVINSGQIAYSGLNTGIGGLLNIDFSGQSNQQFNLSSVDNYVMSGSNYPQSGFLSDIMVFFNNSATGNSTISFPLTWKNIGAGWPTGIISGKSAMVWLRAIDATGLVIGSYSPQL